MASRYDLVFVGLGSAGMTAAEFASTLGIRVAAVERDRVGGDCLWTGCVPSKALLASAKVAHHMRTAGAYGIEPCEPRIDTAKVFERIRGVQRRIAATDDDPERFRALGVDVRFGAARLAGPNAVEVDGERLETRFVLLATGSRPAEPPVPGLAEAGFLTSESVWDVERAPESVVALGGGPIVIEMAQGLRRLGVPVTVLEREDRILPRDEPELVERLVERLRSEGVELRLGAAVERVTLEDGLKVCHVAGGERFAAHELIVGVGRRPNVQGLGLEEAGVETSPRGVVVDASLRTTADRVYAAGDVAGRWLFTHAAGYEGVRAVRNMFFPGRAKNAYAVPWCTFTDPELAHAGLTAAEARERFGDDVEVHRHELAHSDRARADGEDAGAIVVVTRKGRVVGAHALTANAGELIHELALAIDQGLKLSDVGSTIHVYPTLATGVGQLGAEAAFAGAQRFRFLVRSAA
jgi:pyruvate/2-oxoglutarate dehydrogenase complex dihydrolipoamide dehydrogenase (E3) component